MTRRRVMVGPTLAAAATMVGISAPVAATTPTINWMGVERIVVDCAIEDIRPAGLRQRVCDAVVAQTRASTRYPVVLMPVGSRPDPLMAARRGDMLLHVRASDANGPPGSDLLAFELSLARSLLMRGAAPGSAQRLVTPADPDVMALRLTTALKALFALPTPGDGARRFKRAPLPEGIRQFSSSIVRGRP